jgi:hypothetical protein
MLRIIEDLAGDWRRLDARIEGLSSEIETLARRDKACERLMTVPGIGPMISSAMVAASLSVVTLGPFAAIAQQGGRIRRIGLLLGATTEHDPEAEARVSAFRHGLEELGWVDGHNIHIDYRFAAGDADLIRTYVRELVTSRPDLIVANSPPVIAEFRRATGTIPIVFAIVTDPVSQGLVASLAVRGQYHGLRPHRVRDHREMARAAA